MRLLVISHMFPPSRHSNGKRPGYIVQGALEAGWKVDVVTGSFGMERDARETVIHPGLQICRVTDPVDWIGRRTGTRYGLYRLVRLAINGLTWPDSNLWWFLATRRRWLTAGDYDRVLAFILPASVLLVGYVPGLVDRRWIFDYQEPVTPFFEQVVRRSPVHRCLLPLLQRLERRTLHRAGRVVFSTETNLETYVHKGLVRKQDAIHRPYFYDAPAFQGIGPAPFDGFTLGYLGSFDWRGARSPETFLRALAGFLAETPQARAETRFLFHGHWLPEHNPVLEELGLEDVVSLHPPIPYEAYIHTLRRCSVLLLVVSSLHNLFMPSKLVDYFGARRPILAFVPAASEVRRVMERAGMADHLCGERSVSEGVCVLKRLWLKHCAGELATYTTTTDYWSSSVQVPEYLKVLSDER